MGVFIKEGEKPAVSEKPFIANAAENTQAQDSNGVSASSVVAAAEKKVKLTRDRPIKSIFKAITWRIIASATTFALAYMFFYSDPFAAEKATGIALAESAIKMVLYFFHERLWERLRWGRMMVIMRRNTRRSKKSIQRIILRKS